MHKTRLIPLALAAVLATAGCTFQVGEPRTAPTVVPTMKDDPQAPPQQAVPTAMPTAPASPIAEFSDADVTQEINDAVQVVNDYWARHWPDYFTGTYRAPEIKGSYNGDDPNRLTCSGEIAQAFNAFYCIREDYLAWDFNLMKTGYAKGDAWIYLVVAHEWGHAIQNRLQMGLVSEAGELQADCLAGAVLTGAEADGTLNWEEGDTTEIGQALSAFGDDLPWTDPSSHGDAIERVTAFGRGRANGVRGCLAGQDT